jgi:hypothetical protein
LQFWSFSPILFLPQGTQINLTEMDMKNKLIASMSFVAVLSLPTFAANGMEDMNPWAECGIGAMIFKNDVGAVISNIIWDLGTTAVTSALSSKDACSGKEAKTALLIHETYPALADETAKGQGQHLSAVVQLLGCDTNSASAIISSIRVDFATAVSAKDYDSQAHLIKAQNYYNLVRKSVASQCSAS